jgi:hypothetical protein
MFRMNGAFVCSCTNDTSAIHGGRMSFTGAWMRRSDDVQHERVVVGNLQERPNKRPSQHPITKAYGEILLEKRFSNRIVSAKSL